MPPEVLGAASLPEGAKVQRAADLCELLLALGPRSLFPRLDPGSAVAPPLQSWWDALEQCRFPRERGKAHAATFTLLPLVGAVLPAPLVLGLFVESVGNAQ